MGFTKAVLKFAAPVPKPEQFERYLFIGPHPDDIEIGAGATVSRLTSLGKKVFFLVCTDGRFGEGNAPEGLTGAALTERRREEAIASAKCLGVEQVRFLELSDGGFYEEKELLQGIAQIVGDVRPDIIFAPDPCVTSECHRDHLNVGNAAKQIAYFAPYEGIMHGYGAESAPVQAIAYYMTAKPNRFVKTTGHVKKQLAAIFDCHLSQFPKGSGDADSIALYIKLRSFAYGMRSLKGSAEGFRVLGVTQMHCLPEAGN